MIPASLLDNLSPAVRQSLDFALTNVGVCETPPGSNRGPEIDAWATEFGSPLGSPWCALAVAKARKTGGLWFPPHDAGSCNEWLYAGTHAGLVSHVPSPGAAVLYTNWKTIAGGRYDKQFAAVHIGLVLRVEPVLMAIEGNTTIGKYDPNGYVQALEEVSLSRVLAYIQPQVTP